MVLAGDTDSKERSLSFAESVFKIFIRLEYCLYLHNSSTIWVELEKKTKEVHHHWILTIQVSFGVKNVSIGSSRFNVYRFFFASHLQILMTQELSLKVYKVKACLLRLKCSVNSKYKTQVLFSLDRISFQFLYVIGRHISLIR